MMGDLMLFAALAIALIIEVARWRQRQAEARDAEWFFL
jgi:hypothetical protein